ncbi:MAG: DUF4301 family protein [Bacteroides sp.]|nr:DUF4301 family protein [Roseburia sp.]MCM1346594.1 DUF4301 family protein [Bacteroides sp.]MCM1420494.1 DUF4301 family protein [Bacteroides sp.]
MLTQQDKDFIAQKGISEDKFNAQLKCFETGFPFLKLYGAASPELGITVPGETEETNYMKLWEEYLSGEHTILKFVPASGAASRMFKDLFEFLTGEANVPESDFIKNFFAKIHFFAFYDELNNICLKNEGYNIDQLIEQGSYKTVISNLLEEKGLNYGKLPKGLLRFHSYTEGNRTPLEEHLVEGALYASGKSGIVNIHFTVSPEHRLLFEKLVREKVAEYEKIFNVRYQISFSEQKSSTDTVAATADNEPFRTEDGKILFRPGGHGALIENLNELDADIIFVKNIDNVVPDSLKSTTVKYKKLIAGVLVSVQQRIFDYLHLLDSGMYSHAQLEEIIRFLRDDICCRNPKLKELEDSELAIYLRSKLNRPIRVCGMVKNVGEPGGGPFLAYNQDGTISLQILESSQIDKNNEEYVKMFKGGTHFNPVDLVCAVRDYKGKPFNLTKYVDQNTGFISSKSKNGKELKALELPGLWNGAMSDWNTIFVEVPLATFNPVKTVNDLLREQHQ